MDKIYTLAKKQLTNLLNQSHLSNSSISPLCYNLSYLIELIEQTYSNPKDTKLISSLPWPIIKDKIIQSKLVNAFFYALSLLSIPNHIQEIILKQLNFSILDNNSLEDVAFLMTMSLNFDLNSYQHFKSQLKLEVLIKEKNDISTKLSTMNAQPNSSSVCPIFKI